MGRAPVLLLLAASVALADADELVRRARTRLEHGNREGADELLERAVAEDPTCGPALALLAQNSGSKPAPRLRYLEHAQPIDTTISRECLAVLQGLVMVLSEDLCERIERGTMIPVGGEVESQGPWRPWQTPDMLEPPVQPCGPLRQEALGSWAHGHRESVLRIEARFLRDGLDDAVCWARLAVLLRKCEDPAGAHGCLERAHATDLDDRVLVAVEALKACDDPYAWWRLNGESLLADLSAGGTERSSILDPHPFFEQVSKVLGEHRDLVGLARLAIAEWETDPIGVGYSQSLGLATMLTLWPADEAFEAVSAIQGPGADLLRVDLLWTLRQDDLALEAGETLVRRHPEYLPGWRKLANDSLKADRVARSMECREMLFHAVLRGAADPSGTLVQDYVACLRVLGREAEIDRAVGSLIDAEGLGWPALALVRGLPRERSRELRERLLDKLSEVKVSRNSELFWLASFAFDEGRHELGFRLLRGVTEDPRYRFDGPWGAPGFGIESVAAGVARLRGLATAGGLSPAEDALLRQSCGWKGGERTASDFLVRIRCELEADPSFRMLPGAAYALAVLYDPRLQSETVRALRRGAFDSGFRARGLLLDMAADGEPVLKERAKFDPAAARLEAALRSDGAGELTAFLEADEASPAQLQRARIALRARTRGWEVEAIRAAERPSEQWRRLAETVQSHPMAAKMGLQQMDHPRDRVRHTLREFAWPVPDTVDELIQGARGQSTSRYPWVRGALTVLARDGAPALDRLLDELGVDAVRPVLVNPEMDREVAVRALRRGRQRHPLDLRWAGIECALTNDALLAEQVRKARDSNPARLRADGFGDDASLRAYIDMRAADPPASVAQSIAGELRKRHSLPIVGEVLGDLWRRCRTDPERSALVQVARGAEASDLADEWDRVLRESLDTRVRFEAIVRGRVGRPARTDFPPLWDLAREPCWSEAQADTLWTWAAADAIVLKDAERLEEALNGAWRSGLRVARTEVSPGTYIVPEMGGFVGGPVLELIEPRLHEGDDAVPLWFFAWKNAADASDPPGKQADLVARCAAHGFLDDRGWQVLAQSGGPGAPLAACRNLLDTLPPGRESYFGGLSIVSLARYLSAAKRVDEAAACLDAWSERCGPLSGEECSREDPLGTRVSMGLSQSLSANHCFWQIPRPPKAHVARWLEYYGGPAEAYRWIREAITEPWPEAVLAECRFMKTCIEVCSVFPEEYAGGRAPDVSAPPSLDLAIEAVGSLWELSRSATDVNLREKSYTLLGRLYREHPSTRAAFVDLLLADGPDAAPASDEDVQEWALRLGHADVAQRATAERDLRSRGTGALPLLRRLRASTDPEVAARAESILEDLAEP